jgi:two-component system, OmpR family, sensor histidine kinase SenX3
MSLRAWLGRRRRLDRLRTSLDPGSEPARSRTLSDAVDRLEWTLQRHLHDEQAVRATEDRLIRALDVIPQGVALANHDGKVVFRNAPASRFFDARHSEALVEAAINDLIAEAILGEPVTRTLDLYGPPRRAILLRAVPLRARAGGLVPPGEIEGAFIVVEDVSERQRLDAVRRDFVANISHELKTPVGALGLLAETLADEQEPALVKRLAERMQHEAFRVAHTIDDLLELTMIESAELPAHEPVAVQQVLGEAADRMRPAAEMRHIPILVEEPPERLAVVGDRRQLVSAVANLLDNAIKFSDPDESVELRARRNGSWTEIHVQDHGVGIPAVDVGRVFERFYRVDRARSRETGGTGLGLAIVRHVVQNHEGDVDVVSEEGEGSTFILRFPTGAGSVTAPDEPVEQWAG